MGEIIHAPLVKQPEQRLESWKAIATYLKRDIKTCQRWEKSEGMPVHRHLHDAKGSVYAFRTELDMWGESRTPPAASAAKDRSEKNRAPNIPRPSPLRIASAIIAHPPVNWRHSISIGAAVLLLAFAAALGRLLSFSDRHTPPHNEPLVAVLPFQNLSADSGLRYFSDGITQEIVDALLRSTQIPVSGTAASFRFRDVDAAQAAKELAATDILSGSVQRNGNRLRIVAQLTDLQNNRTVWSGTYDRTVAQAPALQEDIALQIADALDMRLSARSLKEAESIDPAAYDHYLRGRDFFIQRKPDPAITELEAAVRSAPNFAKAWSTLAATRFILAGSTRFEDKQADVTSMERDARVAAQRALALDPNSAEALSVLAILTPRGRLADIDRLFERALQAEPNNTQVLNWHAQFLNSVGRNREALYERRRAYELDRVTPSIRTNLASALLEAGFVESAADIIDLGRETLIERNDLPYLQTEYFLSKRDWNGLEKYLSALPDYARAADADFFRLARETAITLANNDTVNFEPLRSGWRNATVLDPSYVVEFLFALGDVEGALDVIETRVGAQGNDNLPSFGEWEPLFLTNLAPLRRSPRVPALLAKWELFDYWRSTNHWPDFCQEPGLPFNCQAEAEKLTRASH